MTAQRRHLRSVAPAPDAGAQPSRIDQAIDRVEQRNAEPDHRLASIRIARQPVYLQPSSTVDLEAYADAERAQAIPAMLLFDPQTGSWVAIYLPPATHWELRPRVPAAPRLWQPGMPS